MIRRFKGLSETKNGRDDDMQRLKTGSEEVEQLTDTPWDDVDPAEFFDPEEFGYRRRDLKHFGA